MSWHTLNLQCDFHKITRNVVYLSVLYFLGYFIKRKNSLILGLNHSQLVSLGQNHSQLESLSQKIPQVWVTGPNNTPSLNHRAKHSQLKSLAKHTPTMNHLTKCTPTMNHLAKKWSIFFALRMQMSVIERLCLQYRARLYQLSTHSVSCPLVR